jgi:septum site-determining protein MinC
MQVYAQGRDLIVLGNVHSGAEVIADGSIHVYGKLAGRALAGMHADSAESGRHLVIACSRFSPELLSISNVYSVCETVPEGAEADERVVVQLADNAQELVFACQPWES